MPEDLREKATAPQCAASDLRQETGRQIALVYDACCTGPLGERIAIRVGLPAKDSLRFEGVGIVRRRRLVADRRLRQRFSRWLGTGLHRGGIGLAEPATDVEGIAHALWQPRFSGAAVEQV